MRNIEMSSVDHALQGIEALLIGESLADLSYLRAVKRSFYFPIKFIRFGANELCRQATFWCFLMLAVMVFMVFGWPKLHLLFESRAEAHLDQFNAIYMGFTIFCGLLAFFSAPSRYAAYSIDDVLVCKTRDILKSNGLVAKRKLRITMIDSLEQTTKSRVRVWFTLAAIVWSFFLLTLKGIDQDTFTEGMTGATFLLFVTLCLWFVAASYARGSQKFIFLLRFADAIIVDEQDFAENCCGDNAQKSN